jgi:hypothetical protein
VLLPEPRQPDLHHVLLLAGLLPLHRRVQLLPLLLLVSPAAGDVHFIHARLTPVAGEVHFSLVGDGMFLYTDIRILKEIAEGLMWDQRIKVA